MIVFYPANPTHSLAYTRRFPNNSFYSFLRLVSYIRIQSIAPGLKNSTEFLSALRANTKLLRIFREQRNADEPELIIKESTFPQLTNSDLTDALNIMCHLYNGFDEGNISLKTWGAMQEVQTTSTFISPRPGTWKTPELTKFVEDDLFNILTECKAWSFTNSSRGPTGVLPPGSLCCTLLHLRVTGTPESIP